MEESGVAVVSFGGTVGEHAQQPTVALVRLEVGHRFGESQSRGGDERHLLLLGQLNDLPGVFKAAGERLVDKTLGIPASRNGRTCRR